MKLRMHIIALVLFVCTLASCSKETLDNTNLNVAENAIEIEAELLNNVNDHRLLIGKNPLKFNEVAYTYANKHNDYMISIGNISHDNFSARASQISAEVGIEFVAENVAKDYANADEAFQGWFNSSSHRKTMEGDFSHTAVSVKMNDDGELYFTQIFYKEL